jgi:hypothetical protein
MPTDTAALDHADDDVALPDPDPIIEFRIFCTRSWQTADRLSKPAEISFRSTHTAARKEVRRLAKEHRVKGLTRTTDPADGSDAATMAIYRLRQSQMAKLMLVLPEDILLDRGDFGRILSRKKYAKHLEEKRQRYIQAQEAQHAELVAQHAELMAQHAKLVAEHAELDRQRQTIAG